MKPLKQLVVKLVIEKYWNILNPGRAGTFCGTFTLLAFILALAFAFVTKTALPGITHEAIEGTRAFATFF